MQFKETKSDGLKRQYSVEIKVNEIEQAVDTRLEELKGSAQIKGFRPGKVPVSYLKKMYGERVFAEVVDNKIKESMQQIVNDNNVRFANQPDIKLPESEEEVKEILQGKKDLSFTLDVELLPEIAIPDIENIEIEVPTFKAGEDEINDQLQKLAEQNLSYDVKKGKAKDKDKVKIDFVGRIDGEKFDGGSAENVDLVLGSGSFIPGFEDQLIGSKAGDEVTVKVKFPETYQVATLAGKDAEFEVLVHEVASPGEAKIDNDLAKNFNCENLDELKERVQQGLQGEYDHYLRLKTKKAMFDALNDLVKCELPESLLTQEFELLNQNIENEKKQNPEAEDTSEDEVKKMAERRVKLGLLIAEIGKQNEITVTNEELQRGVIAQARNYPGREQQVMEYYQKNPQRIDEIRAPIFEEKVVDFLLEKMKKKEVEITKEKLMSDDEDADKAAS